ncbi:MAG: hypothetical protein ACLP9L_42265 [Thermoguttaceae bacterium]
MRQFRFCLIPTVLFLAATSTAWGQPSTLADNSTSPVQQPSSGAGEGTVVDTSPAEYGIVPGPKPPLSDLTLDNFFSSGWDDDFAMRTRATGTPDLPLLRAQTNNLQRLFRNNFFDQSLLNSKTRKDLVDYDGFIDWAFNRRLMLEFDGTYQWVDPRTGSPAASGGAPGILARIQLVDTEPSSLCFNFKVSAPNTPLGTTQTTLNYGYAGFEDLSYWFQLDRVGFYYSFTIDSYAGPAAKGTKQSDMQYDISLAKTITTAKAPISNLTLFVENFAQTDLDGSETGRTLLTVTPGLRFNFGTCKEAKLGTTNAVIMGTDIPVSEYHPWDATYRFTYIKCF